MPDTRRREAVFRLQVEVEHGRMGVLAAGVGEVYAHVRLEWPLVRGEPGVAVYPEERAACRARVGDEMRAEAVQVRPEVFDEQQCGVAYGLFIPLLVFGEPLPVVVPLELAQEIEQVGAEEGGVGHRLSSRLTT